MVGGQVESLELETALSEATSLALTTLGELNSSPEQMSSLENVLGEKWSQERVRPLIDELLADGLPPIEIIPVAELQAKGAFSIETNTIYIADNFIENNLDDTLTVTKVIIEEIGHYLDSSLNSTDRIEGQDEEAIFAAIVYGDFSTSDGWNFRGTVLIDQQAILKEGPDYFSHLSQTFTIPERVKALQFDLLEIKLGATPLAPPDAFEVALLDGETLSPLTSTIPLPESDALLNLQADGSRYTSSQIETTPRTVTIDLAHITPGTQATLYFDLLGFGEEDAEIIIDDVILISEDAIVPIAGHDEITTIVNQSIVIPVLENDSDPDGTINPDSLAILTQPENGSIVRNEDNTITYTPNSDFLGLDTFTYSIADRSGIRSIPAIVTITVEESGPKIGTGTGLLGQYFHKKNLTELSLLRQDATIDFDWGWESPAEGLPSNKFSVRWSGQLETLYSEEYTFYADVNDRVCLWVNGELLIDQWWTRAGKYQGSIQLEAGVKYDLVMEYREIQNTAHAQLYWSSASQVKEIIPTSQLYSTIPTPAERGTGTGLLAEYFHKKDLTELSLLRQDATIDFDWGRESPAEGLPSNEFSVRWSGQLETLYSEEYTFYADVNDRVRLWVNGELLIDQWWTRAGKYQGSIQLEAGVKYDLVMEYLEIQNTAHAQLYWSSASQVKKIIPTSQLYSTIPTPIEERTGLAEDSPANFPSDTQGDEGAIFAAIAQGDSLDETELSRIKTEDDSATLIVDGKTIAVERSDSETESYRTGLEIELNYDPVAVALGDLNSDDFQDLVTAESYYNYGYKGNVSVLLGSSGGKIFTKTNYKVNPNPLKVAIGDFNTDNYKDIVTAHDNNQVSVLWGRKDKKFKEKTDYAFNVENSFLSLEVKDVNGDGYDDIVGFSEEYISILFGFKSKNLTDLTYYQIDGSRVGAALGDLDGDNDLDILDLGSGGSGSVHLYDLTYYQIDGSRVGAALGDLDGDNDLDILDWGSSGSASVHLYDKEDGSFDSLKIHKDFSGVKDATLADVDGDEKLDLIAVGRYYSDEQNKQLNRLSVSFGSGDGTFGEKTDYDLEINPGSIEVGDLDGDGDLDLAIEPRFSSDNILTFLNQGNGTFQQGREIGLSVNDFILGDVDSNGVEELIAVDGYPDDQVLILDISPELKADLRIQEIDIPETVTWGETVELSWKVTNEGNTITTADWSDNIYLSTDTTLNIGDMLLDSFSAHGEILLQPG